MFDNPTPRRIKMLRGYCLATPTMSAHSMLHQMGSTWSVVVGMLRLGYGTLREEKQWWS